MVRSASSHTRVLTLLLATVLMVNTKAQACPHGHYDTVTVSGTGLTETLAQSSYDSNAQSQTASYQSGCSTWCGQQANGTCPVGTLSHTHPDGSSAPTCKKSEIAGGIAQGIGTVIGGVLGGAAKKAAKITYTCSEQIDYTCSCSEAASTEPAAVEQKLSSDPLVVD